MLGLEKYITITSDHVGNTPEFEFKPLGHSVIENKMPELEIDTQGNFEIKLSDCKINLPSLLEPKQEKEPLRPVKMWTNESEDGTFFTTVEWNDGTKTTVSFAPQSDYQPSKEFGGFCAALAKKMFGTTTGVIEQMTKALDKAQAKKRFATELRAANKKLKKELADIDRNNEKKKFDELVQKKLMELRAAEEAQRRYNSMQEGRP